MHFCFTVSTLTRSRVLAKLKRNAVLLVIGKIQLNTTHYCFISSRMSKLKRPKYQGLARMWNNWNSHRLLMEYKWQAEPLEN